MKRGWHYGRWEQSSKVEELEIGLGHRVCEELGAAMDKAVDIGARHGKQRLAVRSLEDVGEMLQMTTERVRQVEQKALRKLRSRLQDMGCWYLGDVE